jgi:AcrR family transcriptional regulator
VSNDSPTPTLRERKKRATRERLLEVALQLFVQRGYDATTMDEIAARADVSRATAFNYFPRKEEFLLAWAAGRRVEIATLLAREQEQEVETAARIEHALTTLCARLEDNAEANRALLRAFVRAGGQLLPGASGTAELFADTIRFGQERGDVRPDVDADDAGRLLLDAYLGAIFRWAAEEESASVSLSASLRTILEVLLNGLARRPLNPRRRD